METARIYHDDEQSKLAKENQRLQDELAAMKERMMQGEQQDRIFP